MKKILKGLLVALMVMGAAHARNHTNKTFLMPRPQGVNLPMEITTYKELIPMHLDDRFGATVAVTPFYQESADHDETGDYFLFKHKHKVTLRTSTTQLTEDTRYQYSDVTDDLDINYLLHDYDLTLDIAEGEARSYAATVRLDPKQTVYGARIDYHQNLGCILKNLYFKADMPIVHVENKPGLKVETTVGTAADFPATYGTDPSHLSVFNQADLAAELTNYLEGKLERRAIDQLSNGVLIEGSNLSHNANIQEKLTHAKILKNSTTGVADIDFALGYKFVNTEKWLFALAIATTIPTGNKESGAYMWEAIAGNGKHWGLGADLCAGVRVWGKVDHNIKLGLKMKYRYLFENDAHRTLGIENEAGEHHYNWGQYHLLAHNPAGIYTPLVPAANVTTLHVDVTPGSQFDGIFDFAYNNGGFNFDLGYNLYYRDSEEVHRKGHIEDSSYAVASRGFRADFGGGAVGGALVANDVDGATLWYVNNENLETSVAETPSQLTNSIYGGMGYTFRKWEVPMMMGIGGKYEWPTDNAALEQWSVWGKMGVTF
jgi:hypothetical protein